MMLYGTDVDTYMKSESISFAGWNNAPYHLMSSQFSYSFNFDEFHLNVQDLSLIP